MGKGELGRAKREKVIRSVPVPTVLPFTINMPSLVPLSILSLSGQFWLLTALTVYMYTGQKKLGVAFRRYPMGINQRFLSYIYFGNKRSLPSLLGNVYYVLDHSAHMTSRALDHAYP